MAFDRAAAKAAGYSDAEIEAYLQSSQGRADAMSVQPGAQRGQTTRKVLSQLAPLGAGVGGILGGMAGATAGGVGAFPGAVAGAGVGGAGGKLTERLLLQALGLDEAADPLEVGRDVAMSGAGNAAFEAVGLGVPMAADAGMQAIRGFGQTPIGRGLGRAATRTAIESLPNVIRGPIRGAQTLMDELGPAMREPHAAPAAPAAREMVEGLQPVGGTVGQRMTPSPGFGEAFPAVPGDDVRLAQLAAQAEGLGNEMAATAPRVPIDFEAALAQRAAQEGKIPVKAHLRTPTKAKAGPPKGSASGRVKEVTRQAKIKRGAPGPKPKVKGSAQSRVEAVRTQRVSPRAAREVAERVQRGASGEALAARKQMIDDITQQRMEPDYTDLLEQSIAQARAARGR